jgi:hypothetical protein
MHLPDQYRVLTAVLSASEDISLNQRQRAMLIKTPT